MNNLKIYLLMKILQKWLFERINYNIINKNDNNRFSQISSLNNDKDESHQTH